MDINEMLEGTMENFDVELYRLEGRYLERFGSYPVLKDINSENIKEIKARLKEAIDTGVEYSED